MTTFMKNGIEVEMPDDDVKSRQDMIIAAEFMARMIRKYGDKGSGENRSKRKTGEEAV